MQASLFDSDFMAALVAEHVQHTRDEQQPYCATRDD